MPKKQWKFISWGADCPWCGNSPEVYTDAEDDFAYDGDTVRCCECGMPGHVSVSIDGGSEEGDAWVHWHDDPECECNWCKEHPA
jgi:hypothetical protein